MVGLKIATMDEPSLGRIAIELDLKTRMTKASLLVQAKSSMAKLVLPLESNGGQSSGDTWSKSLIDTEILVSMLENKT